nr:unnamed protein product [Digitaria exilis]
MAKVPDLGSDFAKKLLKDLRRRRERLGFESAPSPAQRGTASAAAAAPAPRGKFCLLRRRGALAYRQGNSSIAGPGKPRRHDAPAVAQSHAIVPFQGGGGRGDSKRTTPAANAGVDVQMALALALSNSGKLQNVQLVARQGTGGSMFFREPDRSTHLLAPGAHVGKVAITVQKLNEILMAYSSSGDAVRRGSVEIGKQLLRGAMDLEESLGMLMMLQDASDYIETAGNGKVMLLEGGKESWKSSTPRSTSFASAKLVEIFDIDSETEQVDDTKSPSDAFMQIVPHSMSQDGRPNQSSTLQLTTVTNNSKSNAARGEKDDSKERKPSLIAKLMGLENLPSAKAVVERKGTERFVKPEAVPRRATATNAMDDRAHHTSSETKQIPETISEGELQEQQHQMKEVNDQSRNGLDHTPKPDNLTDSTNQKKIVVSCDSFTENQLLLMEMLLKDPYLLETAKSITGFHFPISVIHVDTGKWLDKGNKVLSDVAREVIRRKCKRTEAMVDVNMTRPANLKLQTLEDLIRELDRDIQSLNIPKKSQRQSDNSTAENLKMVLHSDIENTHSDANSVWDFGWNRIWDLPIEKNEVVKDLEKNILGGIITDVARDLIDVSMRSGCCTCEA